MNKKISYEEFTHKYNGVDDTTVPYITIYEKAALIGFRRQQLENGAATTLSEEEINKYGPYRNIWELADIEYKLKKIPLIIKRVVGNNVSYVRPEDLIDR